MELSQILLTLVVLPAGYFLTTKLHGNVWTESETLQDAPAFITRLAAGINVALFTIVVNMLLNPVANWIGFAPAMALTGFFVRVGWWWCILPIFNLITAIIPYSALSAYANEHWGSSKPQYSDWKDFQTNSGRSRREPSININVWNMSPVQWNTQSSLNQRTDVRRSAQANGTRHSVFGIPSFPTSSGVRHSATKTSGSRKSTGSSSSSGGGASGIGLILLWLLRFIGFILAWLGFILSEGLIIFLAYKATMGLINSFDEAYCLQMEV